MVRPKLCRFVTSRGYGTKRPYGDYFPLCPGSITYCLLLPGDVSYKHVGPRVVVDTEKSNCKADDTTRFSGALVLHSSVKKYVPGLAACVSAPGTALGDIKQVG